MYCNALFKGTKVLQLNCVVRNEALEKYRANLEKYLLIMTIMLLNKEH
jgi:hypothetical protein